MATHILQQNIRGILLDNGDLCDYWSSIGYIEPTDRARTATASM